MYVLCPWSKHHLISVVILYEYLMLLYCWSQTIFTTNAPVLFPKADTHINIHTRTKFLKFHYLTIKHIQGNAVKSLCL